MQSKDLITHRIETLLKKNRLKQTELANAVGMSIGTLQNILAGSSRKPTYLIAIADYFDIPVDFFLNPNGYNSDYSIANTKVFGDITNNITLLLERNFITITNNHFKIISNITYNRFYSLKYDKKELQAYIQGIIDILIELKFIKRTTNE